MGARMKFSARQAVSAILAIVALMLAPPALAQEDTQRAADEAAIIATALDYIEGWYDGDAARMERALHPELAKRIVITDPDTGRSILDHMGAMSLVQDTRAAYGASTPEEIRHKDVTILDMHGNAASARIYASRWVDYLHMAKWDGEWKIVNVLFELHPEQE